MAAIYPQSNIDVPNYGGVSEIDIVEHELFINIQQRDVDGNVIINEIPTKDYYIVLK